MATVRGSGDVRRFLAQIPVDLESKVLRGAARAAANVIADEARDRSLSHVVTDSIVTKVRATPGQIKSTVSVKSGWARSLAIWQEYGTDPHFISVDDSQREGRSTRRINDLNKEGASLVIGGQFVGTTVHHPGAKAHPFMRPALDLREAEAIAAAQSYINARVSRAGITGSAEPEESDA
ncbi:HK97 gp10 family phage protein [Sphingomonas sp. CARO-RG-8B-R24-01]|uniref:HK97 gp10 family phage protein n=1 Tax=Sphingomonas sp. CARO-RG-8B-R24-01 TaxID=2914831 RepID=UPI001F5AF91D|nr:HK97 gp10 family phage protein [Sphingomonas sp. CARO-RG-8B-R24-01]